MAYITPRKRRTPEQEQEAYAKYLSSELETKENPSSDAKKVTKKAKDATKKAEDAANNGKDAIKKAKDVIEMIKTGPRMIEYSPKTHEIWNNMLWLRHSCRKPQVAPPPDPVTPLVNFINRIRQECTATPVNPATRANGLFTLAQIFYWNYQSLYHEAEHPFWRDPQIGAEGYLLENAMKAIIDSMSPGEPVLIAKNLCRENLKDIFDCLQDLLDTEDSNPSPKLQEVVKALRDSYPGKVTN